jgi:uncharacterized protein YndB with AHSA1/START domain
VDDAVMVVRRDVDVLTETVIRRPRREVAAYAGDPANAPEWYANIASVEWETPPPITLGSRMAFVATFLGRRLAYTYEVTERVPDERLVMETTYTWEPLDEATTLMTLRNRGRPSGFSLLAAPFMAGAVRRANRRDLARLRTLLEQR